MIFSLLNMRPKTKAVLAGLLIGAGCLWGVAYWQEIPARQLWYWLGATVALVLVVILGALLLTTLIKLVVRGIRRLAGR